ncbi:MAG: efflux RND transporter periplasmic adaptor subunit [Deltaproteobacteria bacterium]|nr:efflux RND transporter periplasmic adaptor subunit [Deltaproteobacteria bacterium]
MIKKIKKISIPGVGIILVTIVLIIFFTMIKIKAAGIEEARKTDLKTTESLANVITMSLHPTDIKEKMNLLAQAEAWADYDIPAEVSGVILKKNTVKGGWVQKGDIIATVNSTRYKNTVDSALASFQLTSKAHDRILKLYEKKAINKEELDKTQAAFQIAIAALNNAEIDLKKCKIRAPASGFIDSFFVEEGEFIEYGRPVALLIDYNKIKIVVNIPESEVANIKNINEFILTIDALGGKTFKGKKYFLSKVPDNLAKVYRLEIKVDNSKKLIFPGMFARVEVVKKENKNTIVIPISGVASTKEGNFVFVEKNGVALKRKVDLGISEGFYVEIKSGLDFDEKLIAVKQGNFEDRQKVRVMKNIETLSEFEKLQD